MHQTILSRSRHGRAAGVFLAFLSLTTPFVRADDAAAMAQMRMQIETLRQKINASTDSAEQARLRSEVDRVVDEGLAHISESARPMTSVVIKVVTPLQSDTAAYNRAAAVFFNSPNAALETIKSREDIANRAKAIGTLAAANARLLARVDSLNADTSRVLSDTRLSPTERMAIRSTLVQQFYPSRNIRELESKIYVGYQNAMAMLDQEWGRWHAGTDGVFVWDQPAAAEKFKGITDELQALADKQMSAQLKLRDAR